MTPPTDTPADRARRAAKYAASPLGPALHYAWGRDARGVFGVACGCGIGRGHAVGAVPVRRLRLVSIHDRSNSDSASR